MRPLVSACWEKSTTENVITIKKKCKCPQHFLSCDEWILSTANEIHRLYLSLPKHSQCSVGIISNRSDQEQSYVCEYDGLDSHYNIFIPQEPLRSVLTLTLDLTDTTGILYLYDNYNISQQRAIEVNVPKGNDIKYKFALTKAPPGSIRMFCETIKKTPLFENYDLSSMTNIVQFIRRSAHCLVFGYVSTSNATLAIPVVIKELCVRYFLGNLFLSNIHLNKILPTLHPISEKELTAHLLNIIFPGNQKLAPMLQKLIDFSNVFYSKSVDLMGQEHSDHFDKMPHNQNLYLSILLSLTEIIDFHHELSQISETNYNKLIVKVTTLNDTVGAQLMYALLRQNAKYYALYMDCLASFTNLDFVHVWKKNLFKICRKKDSVIPLRQLLQPLLLTNAVNIDSSESILSSLLSLSDPCDEIIWLWLNREINNFIATHEKNNFSQQYLSSLIPRILSQIQIMTEPQDTRDEERERCIKHGIELLYVMIEGYNLNIKYEIISFEVFAEFIRIALRSNQYGIIGWKILNMEISKLMIDGRYKHYNDWILFIESISGLIKHNFIDNITIIKNKSKGNVQTTQKQLEIATKTCYNIHFLHTQTGQLMKFASLYKRIKKTKLLKSILETIDN